MPYIRLEPLGSFIARDDDGAEHEIDVHQGYDEIWVNGVRTEVPTRLLFSGFNRRPAERVGPGRYRFVDAPQRELTTDDPDEKILTQSLGTEP